MTDQDNRAERQSEKAHTKRAFIPLWEEWEDLMLEEGESDLARARLEAFAEYAGLNTVTPVGLMFLGFCGGLEMGMEIAREMQHHGADYENGGPLNR